MVPCLVVSGDSGAMFVGDTGDVGSCSILTLCMAVAPSSRRPLLRQTSEEFSEPLFISCLFNYFNKKNN